MDFKNFFRKNTNDDVNERTDEYSADESRFTAVYAIALSSNKAVYEFIDDIYEENKYYYYKLAKESEWYNSICITENSIVRTEYARKTLGIVISGNKDLILEIICRGWGFIYFKASRFQSMDVESIIKEYFKKYDLSKVTSDDVNSVTTIIFLCMSIMNKPMVESTYNIRAKKSRVELLKFYEPEHRFDYDSIGKISKMGIKNMKNSIYKMYNKGQTIRLQELKYIQEEPAKSNFLSNLMLLDAGKISVSSVIEPIDITERDMEEIIASYTITRDNSTPQELLNYISSAIFLKAFIKLYNETKEHYFKNNRETLFLEIEDYKKENEDINERLRILQIQYEKLKDSYENAKKQIIDEQKDIVGEYEGKIRYLDKRITELEKEASIYKREIIPLRSLIFNKENEPPPKSDTIPDKIYQKGIIFGGHERWVQKMRDRLPNFKFINNANFDTSVLDNICYIFFNTEYISHALYYKVINNISNKDIEISYIDNNNENIVMLKILDSIDKK